MPLSVTGKGVMCTVYGVWCMQCSVVCLSRHGLVFTVTAFQAISGEESLPGLSAQGARDAKRQDASQLLRSSTVTPRMSRKCPKCPSPVAARSGFRLPQDLQGSIIWWLPSAQFMLYTCVRTMRAEFTTQGSTNNRGCKLWFRRILARFMLPLAMLHCHGIQWQAV